MLGVHSVLWLFSLVTRECISYWLQKQLSSLLTARKACSNPSLGSHSPDLALQVVHISKLFSASMVICWAWDCLWLAKCGIFFVCCGWMSVCFAFICFPMFCCRCFSFVFLPLCVVVLYWKFSRTILQNRAIPENFQLGATSPQKQRRKIRIELKVTLFFLRMLVSATTASRLKVWGSLSEVLKHCCT